jgi:hypothetical protein
MKRGGGRAAIVLPDGLIVAALVAVNALGDVVLNQTFSSIEDYHTGSAVEVRVTDDWGYAVVGSLDDAVWLAKFTPDTANASDAPESNSGQSPIIGYAAAVIVAVVAVVVVTMFYVKKRKSTPNQLSNSI